MVANVDSFLRTSCLQRHPQDVRKEKHDATPVTDSSPAIVSMYDKRNSGSGSIEIQVNWYQDGMFGKNSGTPTKRSGCPEVNIPVLTIPNMTMLLVTSELAQKILARTWMASTTKFFR